MQVEFSVVLQIAVPVGIAALGGGLRLLWSEIRLLRSEQKEYVTRETCRTHRESIDRQIRDLKAAARQQQ